MTFVTPDITIREMPLPAAADTPEAADFRAVVELNNLACREETGTTDFHQTPEEVLPGWQDTTDQVHRVFLAKHDGRVVGAATMIYAIAETTSAEIDLAILPEYWDAVAADLYQRAEDAVRTLGRQVIQTWTLHPADHGEAPVIAATGVGCVSASRYAHLLQEQGFTLEQAERNSVFDLHGSTAAVEDLLAQSLSKAGDDYRLVEWALPTPPEWREGYGWALSRMSTDVPSGSLAIDEEHWDAERVERRDQRMIDGGYTLSVSAAVHVPSGKIAAFNELVIGRDLAGVTQQYCTLVLDEHRGHRLGLLVKCANLLRWREVAPRSPRIVTSNAAENTHMLAINEQLGFVPASYFGAWQKRLS